MRMSENAKINSLYILHWEFLSNFRFPRGEQFLKTSIRFIAASSINKQEYLKIDFMFRCCVK